MLCSSEKRTLKSLCLLLIIALILPACNRTSVQQEQTEKVAQRVDQKTEEVAEKTKKGPHRKKKRARLVPSILTTLGVGMAFPFAFVSAAILGGFGAVSVSVPFMLVGLPAIGLGAGIGAGVAVYKSLGKK